MCTTQKFKLLSYNVNEMKRKFCTPSNIVGAVL